MNFYSDALSTTVMVGMVALLPGCGVPPPTQGALGVRVSFLFREQGGSGAGAPGRAKDPYSNIDNVELCMCDTPLCNTASKKAFPTFIAFALFFLSTLIV